jgi:hypothetical protein
MREFRGAVFEPEKNFEAVLRVPSGSSDPGEEKKFIRISSSW